MKKLFNSPTYLAALAVVVLAGIGAYIFTKSARPEEEANRAARGAQAATTDSSEKGPLALDFALKQLSGQTFRLSDYRGKVVVINFWATWCPPCRKEIPDLIAMQKEMRGDVLFVGISIDKGSSDKVRAFAEKFGINYPIVIDDGTVVKKYGPIRGVPTTFFVGTDGRISVKASGLLTKEKLRPVLQVLVEGDPLEEIGPPFRHVARPLGIE